MKDVNKTEINADESIYVEYLKAIPCSPSCNFGE